jgi:uroporphyrinogen-III synthase
LIVRLLLTRPEPDAQRTATVLRTQGHDVIIAPLLRIAPVADAQIGAGPWAAILITSANAAIAVAAHARATELRALPVFAVGRRSAGAMAAAGFADVTSADGNVSDLARLVAARMRPTAPLLYLAGEDRSGDLAGDLRAHGFAVETATIYRAIAASNLPPEAADALAGGICRGGAGHGRARRRAASCPFLSVDADRGAARPGRRRRHPRRRASKRGLIARAYCRGLICCRHPCPVLCRGGRPYPIGRFGGARRTAWKLHERA